MAGYLREVDGSGLARAKKREAKNMDALEGYGVKSIFHGVICLFYRH